MSDMVERVAKAIAQNQHQSWLYDEKTSSMCDPKKIAAAHEALRNAARAAIESMLEPTEEMTLIGERAIAAEPLDSDAYSAWRAMIATALG